MIVAALGVLLVPQSASADKPSFTCPPAFDLGAHTLAEALLLPRTQAGLAAGAYDVEALTEIFEAVDSNDDGLICFQTVPPSGTQPGFWPFNYNVVDNSASVPG
jgi:hypothetical protein